jgi:hypothetical protein
MSACNASRCLGGMAALASSERLSRCWDTVGTLGDSEPAHSTQCICAPLVHVEGAFPSFRNPKRPGQDSVPRKRHLAPFGAPLLFKYRGYWSGILEAPQTHHPAWRKCRRAWRDLHWRPNGSGLQTLLRFCQTVDDLSNGMR